MRTRAAVAFEARKPLEIVEVELDGPRSGEVLVEIMATGSAIRMPIRSMVSTAKVSFRPSWDMKAPELSARSAQE
jgi:hypothetical protein